MIEKLSIRNFRGLESIEMRLAPFTLIAGANNVGKTSVLEALFLLYGHRSPLVFNQLLSFRNAQAPDAEAYDLWENVFSNYDISRHLCISTTRDDKRESLTIHREDEEELVRGTTRLPKGIDMPTSSLNEPYPLKVTYEYGDGTTHFHLVINAETLGVDVLSKRSNNTATSANANNIPIVSFASDRLQNPAYLYDLLGKASRSKQKDKIVNVLKGIDNRINDIILGDKQQIYIDIAGMTEVIPLSFLGAGVSNVLYWTALVLSNSAKILLIDEIENGIHFTSIQPVMERLCEIGKMHDCQIIATTHSIDCVSSFSKCPKERIGYIRLERCPETGAISPVEIDSQLLPEMLKSEWEVR